MSKYTIWIDRETSWDKDNLPKPAATIEAVSADYAAEALAERLGGRDAFHGFIVRDDATGQFHKVELVKKREIDLFETVTLEELCAP